MGPIVYQVIALKDLQESALNPRKAFDEETLKELCESLKAKGCIEPIIVRRMNGSGSFEVVAGARRFRAAKMAELDELPAIVREYTDAECMEIQVIENLQREDVNPVEEADGYRQLIDLGGYTKDGKTGSSVPDVERLAEKIGKSERYVYDRLTLAGKLIPEAREAGAKGWITASHLVELARLEATEQARALNACLTDEWWSSPDDLPGTMEAWRQPAEHMDDGVENRAMSVRQLQNFIADRPKVEAATSETGQDDQAEAPKEAEEHQTSAGQRDAETAEELEASKDRVKRQERAKKENERRNKLLIELAASVRGPIQNDELVLLFSRACGSNEEAIKRLVGAEKVDRTDPVCLRQLLMVAMIIADRNFTVSEWSVTDGKAAPACEPLDAWAAVLSREPKSDPKPAKMNGIEVVKKIKAGAKAMKVKVGGKKKKGKGGK
jgi:ParB/RepB/Spo0J family partition protein